MTLVAIDLVEGFFQFQSTPLELDLDEGDPVYQERDVVAILIRSLNGNLAGDLELVLTPLLQLQELYVDALARVPVELHFIPEYFTPFEDITAVQVVGDFPELVVREFKLVMLFKLCFQVGEQF